jgi:hypothetical protein
MPAQARTIPSRAVLGPGKKKCFGLGPQAIGCMLIFIYTRTLLSCYMPFSYLRIAWPMGTTPSDAMRIICFFCNEKIMFFSLEYN